LKALRYRKKAYCFFISCCLLCATLFCPAASAADERNKPDPVSDPKRTFEERIRLFEKIAMVTGIPWYELAAIDQYERDMSFAKKRPSRQGLIGIDFNESDWVGKLNPDHNDTNPISIAFFQGIGIDGSGDGAADRNNEADVLAAMAALVLKHGASEDDRRIALWDYYQNNRSIERIRQFAKIYRTFGTLNLYEHAFPLPLGANYTYRSTWGASRGWGGSRIHEGTDLFADYGVPVRSTCYGIVEVKGWNPYGGWRIGIRDLNSVYHYYAHLSGYNKEIKQGDVVKPGQTIGWVGSSGYGKPGTSGKFPPHLHFGLYRDNGLADWSFDPYPYLRKWEREERQRGKTKRG
jgi:murein DD-endopeptidase MepM/ murein hydrolase activator NlpD